MNVLLLIIGILVLGFLMNVVLKLTYNLIFFIGKKPLVWIIVVTILSPLIWAICAFAGWSVSVPACATTMAAFMNWPPKLVGEAKDQANAMYSEMSLKNGPLLHRAGLCAFIATAILSYLFFYG